MKKIILLTILGFLSLVFGSERNLNASTVIIKWAGTVAESSGVQNPDYLLNKPDNLVAVIGDYTDGPDHATMSNFGTPDSISYDSEALANFLGVSEELLAQADFLTFEQNPRLDNTYEPCSWTFTDGSNSGSHQLKSGFVTGEQYASFFGLSDSLSSHSYPFLLFDIDDQVAINSPNFKATITASGNSGSTTPDPDASGIIIHPVPIPGSFFLLLSGILGLAVKYKSTGKKLFCRA